MSIFIVTRVFLTFAFISAVNLATSARAGSYFPTRMQNFVQICVERFEDEGVANISPIVITISQNSKISLIGGEAGCVFVNAGNQSISLTFYNPYSPQSTVAWTTKQIYFVENKGKIARFQLCRAKQSENNTNWSTEGWHDMWLLRRFGEKSGQRCA